MNPRMSPLVVLALIIGLVACGTDVPPVDVTVDYEATTWILTGTIDADALAEGATLDLSLEEGGVLSGTLFLPASINSDTELIADMAGNWSARNDTVRFSQGIATFVRELEWLLTPNQLIANDTIDGTGYEIELTRIF